jgi:glycosyltransferase involved in cell wall biosynthesis
MVAKKAPILTLDAFRRAAKHCPELRLDYIGAGALLPAARQFIHAFALQDKVFLHGSQTNDVVREFMRHADIFIQHSMVDSDSGDEEGLPVAILEGMADALPVISTLHAGIPEAVIDGTTGYLVSEGDSDAMAQWINFLARQPDRRKEMGRAGWERARELFSWERERTALLHILGLS